MSNERGNKESMNGHDMPEVSLTSLASMKLVLVLVMTFLGAGILFSSWIAQNYFQAKWLNERLYLEKTQFLVQIEQNNAEMWQIQLNLESAREPRNAGLLMSAAFNFIRSITTLLAWEEARITEGSIAPIAVKNLSHDVAKQLLDKGDLDGLLRLAVIATTTKSMYQSQLDKKYFEQMEQSQENAMRWNKRFMWCYVAGMLLLGLRWIMTGILAWPNKLTWKTSRIKEVKEKKPNKTNSADVKKRRG